MFPEGGQTRKHCFLAMFPKGGQTRKRCFLAMYRKGEQTRKDCFLATLPEGGQTIGSPKRRVECTKCFQMSIYIKLAPFLCHLSRAASTQ
jgi:hypothetical protein